MDNSIKPDVSVDINALYSAASRGDHQAEERLFEGLSARFRLFVRQRIRNQADAEEVVQETLMTIYKEYRSVEYTKSFSAWAYKVLDNRILGCMQKRKRENGRTEAGANRDGVQTGASDSSTPGLKQRLLECLQKIGSRNVRYARILNLHYQGYETDEICTRLSLKPETFYSILSRARSLLESCLEKGDVK